MWKRFSNMLCCPACRGELQLVVLKSEEATLSTQHEALGEKLAISRAVLAERVEAGLLLCAACKARYPILRGVPILLTYTTPLHQEFSAEYDGALSGPARSYAFPKQPAPVGEAAVQRSFSKEWGDYAYDGVIWEMNYADHEKRFLAEMGFQGGPNTCGQKFIEIGCGIGITVQLAHDNFQVDAVGVDLSIASVRAAQHYRDNPFLHFVQASAFHLPFPARSFDMVYSRGVLHHTYSTRHALEGVAALCKDSGFLYLWVYGKGSIDASPLRRIAYKAEKALRPVLSRQPDSPTARLVLAPLSIAYMAFNLYRRVGNPQLQGLTYSRALHAARDRFTPQFAHRHGADEVESWFRELGFEKVEQVDWRAMPRPDHEDYSRNVGVRGRRKPAPVPGARAS